VIAELPGEGDDWVIIGSHHDAPWASAVEDASGVALVLAQAAYWSAVPRKERPHNLMFVLHAGHMCASVGGRAFVETHATLLERTVLEVHLEHVAKELTTDQPEPRWWFTSTIPALEAAVDSAIKKHDLRRSLVLRPNTFAPNPPTDGSVFDKAGVPLVSYLSAPVYLFDSVDTVDKIHVPSLEPITGAVIDIIKFTSGQTATSMREGVAQHDLTTLDPLYTRART
jgi:hypothetical protein